MTYSWIEVRFGLGGTYELPDKDGVYVIAEIIDDRPNVRYVGSGNIYDRINDHQRSDEPNSCLKNVMSDTSNVKIRFTLIGDNTKMYNVEYTFYKYYLDHSHSLCNQRDPPGEFVPGLVPPF